jgi:hypothetical protein
LDENKKLSENSISSSDLILPPIEKFLISNELIKREKKYETISNLVDLNQILDRFKEDNNNNTEFGSYKYTIRSRPANHYLTSSSTGNIDSYDIFSSSKQTANIKSTRNREKPKALNQHQASDQSAKQELNNHGKTINNFEKLDSHSCSFEYNKVTNDIYKNFGILKNYPQNLSQLNKIKNKPIIKKRNQNLEEINRISQDEELNSNSTKTQLKPFDNIYRNNKKSIYFNRFILSKSEGSIGNISRTENKTPSKILKAQ